VSEPRYKNIADDLRRRIALGDWEVGQKIPSIAELMGIYDVPSNLNMIRHAQSVLIGEGLLRAEQGRGVFVIAAPGAADVGRTEALAAIREAMRLLKCAETALEASGT
jgi:DNA-binding GntR family transcriptional regulator